jgi:hypothetical protein
MIYSVVTLNKTTRNWEEGGAKSSTNIVRSVVFGMNIIPRSRRFNSAEQFKLKNKNQRNGEIAKYAILLRFT